MLGLKNVWCRDSIRGYVEAHEPVRPPLRHPPVWTLAARDEASLREVRVRCQAGPAMGRNHREEMADLGVCLHADAGWPASVGRPPHQPRYRGLPRLPKWLRARDRGRPFMGALSRSANQVASHRPLLVGAWAFPRLRAAATKFSYWGLIMAERPDMPVRVNEQVKIVWRIAGSGELGLTSIAPDGRTLRTVHLIKGRPARRPVTGRVPARDPCAAQRQTGLGAAVELPAASIAAKTRLCVQGQAAGTARRMTSTSSSRVGPGAYVGRQPSW